MNRKQVHVIIIIIIRVIVDTYQIQEHPINVYQREIMNLGSSYPNIQQQSKQRMNQEVSFGQNEAASYNEDLLQQINEQALIFRTAALMIQSQVFFRTEFWQVMIAKVYRAYISKMDAGDGKYHVTLYWIPQEDFNRRDYKVEVVGNFTTPQWGVFQRLKYDAVFGCFSATVKMREGAQFKFVENGKYKLSSDYPLVYVCF
eukprot:TRINITY_DN2412_c0_g1_i1.p2 TRINITY_DN2412_c0_g1~~TRINITY_DN2412_c0_g1_i1.p2  ORF type:complete len:227 (-),score=7.08 TRINITY_DN2412_c0_g1_i1:1407-2009(-)